MDTRKNKEPSEGALLLSGVTKTEGFQFSHALNYEHHQTLCFSNAHNAGSLCLVMTNNRSNAGENKG